MTSLDKMRARAVRAFVDQGEKMLLFVLAQFDVCEGESGHSSLQGVRRMSLKKAHKSTHTETVDFDE